MRFYRENFYRITYALPKRFWKACEGCTLTPKARYIREQTIRRWERTEDYKYMQEVGPKILACGEIGRYEGIRFITSGGT